MIEGFLRFVESENLHTKESTLILGNARRDENSDEGCPTNRRVLGLIANKPNDTAPDCSSLDAIHGFDSQNNASASSARAKMGTRKLAYKAFGCLLS